MKKSNFSFKDIKGILTRDEMKQIKGGSGGSDSCYLRCSTDSGCSSPCPRCVWSKGDNANQCIN